MAEIKIQQLTAMEHSVLRQICKGLSTNEIAIKLATDENEIFALKENIFKKLGIKDWRELMTFAIKKKWLI